VTTLTVHRTALLPALAALTRVVERRNTIPILSNLRLVAEGDRLRLSATDLDMELTAEAELLSGTAADFTMPAQLAHDFVKKLPESAEVGIRVDQQNVTLISGRSRALLHTLPSSDFPQLSSGEFPHRFAVPAPELARLIDTASFAMSTEETRYYLNGIFLTLKDELLRAVATDGHRLARVDTKLPEGAIGMPGVILPRKAVLEVSRMLGGLKGEAAKADIGIELSDTKIRFAMPTGERLLSKLVDGTFPDYERVVPTGNANRFTVSGAAMASAVDRVATISSERGRAVKFVFGASETTLACANPDQGSAEDAVPTAKADGDEITVGFNSKYCLDVLTRCGDADAVFALADGMSPAVVTGKDPQALFVLMPMRV
jgi:DNA polymerase-3 subunit beta